MSRVKHEIALKKPEERTTWDLFQVFFATVKCGSYKKAADYLLISPQAVYMALHDLESRLSQKIINHLPKNNMEMERYSPPLMTSEGAKWYLVVSELTNKENIEERLSYFKRESMMPFGFEPIAYNMWQLSQRQFSSSHGEEPTFCLIKLSFKEDGKMKEFKILTTDFFSSRFFSVILEKLIFKYPDVRFSIVDATIDREPDVDLYALHYKHPMKNFISETVAKGMLGLYASSHYLEKKGIPETMDDLLNHNIIRPKRSDVLRKFAHIKYPPIFYKESAIEVDTLSSLYLLGEAGAGIICNTDLLTQRAGLKLERLPELSEPIELDYSVGYKKEHHNNLLAQEIKEEVRLALVA